MSGRSHVQHDTDAEVGNHVVMVPLPAEALFQRHQVRKQVVQFLDGQHFGEVVGHERFLQDLDFVQVAFEEGVKAAVLLVELDAEVGFVDAQAA